MSALGDITEGSFPQLRVFVSLLLLRSPFTDRSNFCVGGRGHCQKTLTFARRATFQVAAPRALTCEALNPISLLSPCLPASPYGPSCLSLDGCSPCPCPSSLWALASSTLRTKASTWPRGTSTFFSCGECVGEAQRRHLISKQRRKTEPMLIYCSAV